MLRHRTICLIAIVCVLWLTVSIRTVAQGNQNIKKNLSAMKTEQSPTIDGRIDDPCWQNAPQATDFTDPLLGTPAKDQTVARLLYNDQAIYAAIYAFDSQPDKIIARQTKDQTRFSGEDVVAFSIDPFHTHQFSDRNFFVVNPLGTKFAHLATGRAEKAEWLGLWKAAAQITEDGWTVEMKIPWQMLAYPDANEPITMGINFDRFQQRTGEKSWWSNVEIQEFYEYDGHWVDVLPPAKKKELKFLPYLYFGREENSYIGRAGLNLRYLLTHQLTLVSTVNPDFENIEQAVEGIDFSYGVRFVPDRRPFFQEGRNVFRLWEYYHSRQISDVDGGVSLFGKIANPTSVGLLSTFQRGGEHNFLFRVTHSVSASTNVGTAYIGHRESSGINHVGFLEGETRWGKLGVGANFAQTWNEDKIGRKMRGHVMYRGSRVFAGIFPFFIDPDFVNKLGYHPFTGIRGAKTGIFIRNEWQSGFIRRVQFSTSAEITNRYNGSIFSRNLTIGAGLQTRSDYGFQLEWNRGRFEEYRHEGTFSVKFQGRVSDQFTNYGVNYERGRREDVVYRSYRVWGNLRMGPLTTGLTFHFVHHREKRQQHIWTLNYDFTSALSLGGRLVWQESGQNVYFVLRRSGYAGTDFYVILGDPNAESFQRRLVAKVVKAF